MEKLSFEQRLSGVKEIADGIEKGQLSLEESVRQFETGIRTLKELEQELEGIKRRITMLQENTDGTLTEKKLEEET